MAKLDRLGWATGLVFVAYGVRVGIRTNDQAILARLTTMLPPGWRAVSTSTVDRLYSLLVGDAEQSGPGIRKLNLVYADAVGLARSRSIEDVLRALESDLHLYVAEMAQRRVFVHAGVVGWRGRAIVLPGPSFSGKSTLVNALVRAGASYYSDEFAVIDADGRIHAYPRPLALRDGGPAGVEGVPAPGAGQVPQALRAGLIVLTRFRPGARWRPRTLSPGATALALLANTVSARRDPERALAAFSRALASARGLASPRGDADETAAALLEAI